MFDVEFECNCTHMKRYTRKIVQLDLRSMPFWYECRKSKYTTNLALFYGTNWRTSSFAWSFIFLYFRIRSLWLQMSQNPLHRQDIYSSRIGFLIVPTTSLIHLLSISAVQRCVLNAFSTNSKRLWLIFASWCSLSFWAFKSVAQYANMYCLALQLNNLCFFNVSILFRSVLF